MKKNGKVIKLSGKLEDMFEGSILAAFSSSGRKHLGRKVREYRLKLNEANTLLCGDYCTGQSTKTFVLENYDGLKIRYLTVGECERLMTWETDHTKYGVENGTQVEITDTQRYKMCGNGVVSNCTDPLIDLILEMENTL